MLRFTMIALAATVSTAAMAAPVERVRGTIESTDGKTLTLKTDDGASKTIGLAPDTKYASVLKASLDQIKDGVFIGTATKGDNPPTALEVVLFPEAMRGTGEGHYAWDEIQDTTAGGTKTKSSMTNGTVKAAVAAPKVKSSMTNGTVAKSDTTKSAGSGGTTTLTVTYGGDGTKTIAVPASAPVVTFEPADAAIMTPGAHAFVIAGSEDGKLSARRVAVGKDGLRPPM